MENIRKSNKFRKEAQSLYGRLEEDLKLAIIQSIPDWVNAAYILKENVSSNLIIQYRLRGFSVWNENFGDLGVLFMQDPIKTFAILFIKKKMFVFKVPERDLEEFRSYLSVRFCESVDDLCSWAERYRGSLFKDKKHLNYFWPEYGKYALMVAWLGEEGVSKLMVNGSFMENSHKLGHLEIMLEQAYSNGTTTKA